MTLLEFKNLLLAHPNHILRFVLPDDTVIPAHYHITEVGHVQKNFIDCGGAVRSLSACVLQTWVADDLHHRLIAGKLATIIDLATTLIPSFNLPVELEHEAPVITQLKISSSKVQSDTLLFYLEHKHTDCLAKEKCGIGSSTCC